MTPARTEGAARWLALVVAVAVGLGSGGCSSLLVRRYPEKGQYVLEARRPEAAPGRRIGTSLVVRPFRASPRLAGAQFVYRIGDEQYEPDFYHVFWAAPEALIGDQTARWLEMSGLFQSVWDVRSVLPPALMLEGGVIDLYADYRASGPPVAVIALAFALVDVERAPPAVAFHEQYRATVPAAEDTPEALVAAWGAALRDVLGRFEADLTARGLR